MKRFWLLALLTLMSSSAQAGSFSFSVGGHRIHIESSRYCRSTSCASVSISGISESRREHDGDRDIGEAVKPAPPVAAPAPAVAQPAGNAAVPAAAPPAVYKPAAAVTQSAPAPLVRPTVVAPPAPAPAAIVAPPAPPVPPPIEKPIEAVRPLPAPVPSPIARVSQQVEDEPADAPLGDWQTEGKGEVRISKCGRALCGYVISAASDDKGAAVLINMKPKSDTQWTGNVYSHDSGTGRWR